ncbi:MAG: MarR family transcriptional regulator [Pseudomonadota bacterium]|nr:MarR family transcriptional regulator [Pseudomonadota bacterium]
MQNHHSVEEIYGYCADNWPETHTPEHLSVLCQQRLAQLDAQAIEQIAAQHQLTASEFDVLATLRRAPAPHVLNPTELQRSTLLSSGGQTKLLHHLQAKGMVKRSVAVTDKRSKLVHLTAKGKRHIEPAMAEVLQQHAANLTGAGLSDKEFKLWLKVLQKLLRARETDADR